MVYYFAQNCTLQAKRPGRNDYETIGAVQEVTAEWSVDDTQLRQFGTIERVDASRSNSEVAVTVNFAKFGKNDWYWAILNGAGWTHACNGAKVTVSDSTNFPLFQICGEFRSSDGTSSERMYMTIKNVYFKSFNFGGSMGEYIIENLEGSGSNIEFSDEAPTGWEQTGHDLSVYSPTGGITVNDGDTVDVTVANYGVQIVGPSHKYAAGSADVTIATASVNCNTGVFQITGVTPGIVTVFMQVDGGTLAAQVTVI